MTGWLPGLKVKVNYCEEAVMLNFEQTVYPRRINRWWMSFAGSTFYLVSFQFLLACKLSFVPM